MPQPRVADWWRALRRDLAPAAGSPLPPLSNTRVGWAAWLPHAAVAVVSVYAVVLAGFAWHTLIEDFGIPNRLAGALAVAHAVSVVLCLYWPTTGWWMSLGSAVVATVVAEPDGVGVPLWTGPSLVIHLSVLVLVGLRARARVLVEMWLLTLLAGVVLAVAVPGTSIYPDLVEMTALSGAVLILAGAVRARADALRRLAEQQNISDVERARRALLEERTRIARELHDVVAHHMSVIAIQAEAAPYRVPDLPEELAHSFAAIRSNALEALTELRRVLGVLRADGAEDDPAPQPTLNRLDDLVVNARSAGLAVTAAVDGPPRPLPPGVELSAYRIVQEALSNAMRHAPGSQVRVEVAHRPAGLEVRVVNGPPQMPPQIPPARSPGAGHGMPGMRERAAMLGGQLTAGPAPDGGYAVSAFLPTGGGEGR